MKAWSSESWITIQVATLDELTQGAAPGGRPADSTARPAKRRSGSEPDHSWAFSTYGSNRVRILGGTQGDSNFCGVQVHNSEFGCGGQGIDFVDGLTADQAAACRAEVLNFAAAQNGTCN
ncbi:hypothetical protein [Sorangium sp. So ce128]|uniref:hypothetical protein n=1 Tax=Sorangium sp. So ce128 TaxID=3133281 RepID=UPI003F6324B7